MIIGLQTGNHKEKGGTGIGYRRKVLIAIMQMADVDWQRSQTVACQELGVLIVFLSTNNHRTAHTKGTNSAWLGD
jgi:hypothetical protein